MFSATMPPAVEKMAKKYLRHPAIVQIGDEDTGKNRRIEQRVLWMTEAQKKAKVRGDVFVYQGSGEGCFASDGQGNR